MSGANAAGMRSLLERRATLKNQLQAIHDKHPDGSLPENEQRQWDTLRGELQSAEQAIERQALLDDTERSQRGTPIAGMDRRWQETLADYSLCRALLYHDANVDTGREREVSAELEKRSGKSARGLLIPDEVFRKPVEMRAGQVASDAVAGGFLVGDQLRGDQFIDLLRSASVLPRLNVIELTGCVGSQSIPKEIGGSTVEWIPENGEPNESNLDFGALNLTPRTAAGQVPYSRRMLLNATPSIEALVRADLAAQQAIALDRAAIAGQGQAEPLGLLNRPGVKVLATTSHALTYDSLVDAIAAPQIADAAIGGMSWLTNPKVVAACLKLKDGYERPYFNNQLPNTLLAYGMVQSTSVPSDLGGANYSALLFGAWNSVIVARWGNGLDVLSNPYSKAGSGQIIVHTFQDCDVAVRHEESFAVFTDIAA